MIRRRIKRKRRAIRIIESRIGKRRKEKQSDGLNVSKNSRRSLGIGKWKGIIRGRK